VARDEAKIIGKVCAVDALTNQIIIQDNAEISTDTANAITISGHYCTINGGTINAYGDYSTALAGSNGSEYVISNANINANGLDSIGISISSYNSNASTIIVSGSAISANGDGGSKLCVFGNAQGVFPEITGMGMSLIKVTGFSPGAASVNAPTDVEFDGENLAGVTSVKISYTPKDSAGRTGTTVTLDISESILEKSNEKLKFTVPKPELPINYPALPTLNHIEISNGETSYRLQGFSFVE
jgi:hypothetical protein